MIASNPQIKRFVFLGLGILVLANILAWIAVFDLAAPCFLEVNFFDVGEGDAVFVETPQRHQILIDGGPDSTISEKLGEVMPFYDRSLDLVVLTHPDRDHLGGLIEVLERYQVRNILWTGVSKNTAVFEQWNKRIEKEKALQHFSYQVKRVSFSDQDRYLSVLYPRKDLRDKKFEEINNTSLVAKLIFGQNSFLFPGDIHQEVESQITEDFYLNSDLLKVAHHGSRTSTSIEFLKEVSPQIAVISVGKDNSFHHPHSEVLERLKNFGIRVLRTDQVGDVKIISNPFKFKVIYGSS